MQDIDLWRGVSHTWIDLRRLTVSPERRARYALMVETARAQILALLARYWETHE